MIGLGGTNEARGESKMSIKGCIQITPEEWRKRFPAKQHHKRDRFGRKIKHKETLDERAKWLDAVKMKLKF